MQDGAIVTNYSSQDKEEAHTKKKRPKQIIADYGDFVPSLQEGDGTAMTLMS